MHVGDLKLHTVSVPVDIDQRLGYQVLDHYYSAITPFHHTRSRARITL